MSPLRNSISSDVDDAALVDYEEEGDDEHDPYSSSIDRGSEALEINRTGARPPPSARKRHPPASLAPRAAARSGGGKAAPPARSPSRSPSRCPSRSRTPRRGN